MSARTTIGSAAIEAPLLLPVGDALNVALPVIDGDGDPLDVSGITWSARVFAPADSGWAGWSIPAAVAADTTITLVASAAAITTALGDRTRLRWELRNETAGRDVLRGPVSRLADGWGIRSGVGNAVLQIGETTTVVQVPAATVVNTGSNIDGGTASSVFGGTLGIDGGSA